MSETLDERLERELLSQDDLPERVPYGPKVLSDAHYVARYFRDYFAPEGGARSRPGLRAAQLSADTASEMYRLIDGIEAVNKLLYAGAPPQTVDAVRRVSRELRVALEWLAQDDRALEAQLANMRSAHASARTEGDLVVALEELTALAHDQAGTLNALDAFDGETLRQVDALLKDYRERSGRGQGALLARRAGLVHMLQKRIRRVIAAADFVFRRHPQLAREARPPRLLRRAAASAKTRRARSAGPEAPATRRPPPPPPEPRIHRGLRPNAGSRATPT